jgi:alpha-D-xyloside xylohydrolase
MVRAVALEFPDDRATYEITDQYLFGGALMVCPIIEPMYFDRFSQPIDGKERARRVYLPKDTGWFDFRVNSFYAGGAIVTTDAPLDGIPVFARAGSIVPMTEVMQFVDEVQDAAYEIRVYAGADARFTIYEDAGDGYAYEQGEFAECDISWHENSGELLVGRRRGEFRSMTRERDLKVVIISEYGCDVQFVRYAGQEIRVRRKD